MKKVIAWTTAVGAAVLMALTVASAQERRQTDQKQDPQRTTNRDAQQNPNQATRDQAGRGRTQGDSQLASWLAICNEGEIEIGKFAAERAHSDEVKAFAQKMVDEHTNFLNKLQRMGAMASTTSGQPARPGARPEERVPARPGDAAPRKDATGTAQKQPADDTTIRRGYLDPEGRLDFIRIKQEIGRNCVETLKKEFGEKSGAEFDVCYMGHQILAHLEMADTLKVMKNHASPELRDLIASGEKTTKQHLDEAKEIIKGLDEVAKDSKKSDKDSKKSDK
jgi:predicted outer membrane protein